MSNCLYCGEAKAAGAFNREHVLPQAFGRFANNLVLRNSVCIECNTYFSRELESPLARDSEEGLERFDRGHRMDSSAATFGQTRTHVCIDGGPADGARLELRPVDGVLKASDVDQIGVARSPDGPFEWYRLTCLPGRRELEQMGIVPGSAYFRLNIERPEVREEALELLRERGFTPGRPQPLGSVHADGMVPTTRRGVIDRTILRAVAKIAFNYFAYWYPALARMENCAEIRRFVRYGDWPPKSPVTMSDEPILAGVPPERRLVLHVIALSWDANAREIRARVSLLSVRQYQVSLGRDFVISPEFVECGHAFDPVSQRILALGRVRTPADLRPPPMADTPEDDDD